MPRLKDTEVSAVALVKHPANRRKFLMRKRAGDSQALVPASDDAVAAIRAEILAKSDLSEQSRQVLEAIGRLAHGNDELSAADLLSVGVAAGLGAVAKAKKQDPADQAEDDDADQEDAQEQDDEADFDEDEEGDQDQQEEDEEEPPKEKMKKGGPGSGRYPAGSGGNNASGAKSESSRFAEEGRASSDVATVSHSAMAQGGRAIQRERDVHAAGKASAAAEKSGTSKDHNAAAAAHEKAASKLRAYAKTLASRHDAASVRGQAASHAQAAQDHKNAAQNVRAGIMEKSRYQIELFADTSAEEGEPMEANVEKSEKVDVAKAMDEMRAQLAKAQGDLEIERDHRLTKAIKEEMVSAFPNLSIDRDHLTSIVKSMRQKEDRADNDNLMAILKAADAQVAAAKQSGGDITKPVSKSTWTSSAVTSGSYKEKQDAIVNAFIAKSGKPMTYWEAHNALSASPTPEFAALADGSN